MKVMKQLTDHFTIPVFALLTLTLSACGQEIKDVRSETIQKKTEMMKTDTATFGGGCFWCTEAQFDLLKGVISVTSGYSGGTVRNPSYKEVCTGRTGHAEVVQVVYDPTVLSYEELLEAFWQSHDPTQLNRQGNDIGTQYRSVIFYHNEEQHKLAEKYKKLLNESGAYESEIVTEISALTEFYKAEEDHQNYFNENGSQPYCRFVVSPKVDKFRKVFKEKLK
jgi:peptide-methionine (S)-S-oxide reductase